MNNIRENFGLDRLEENKEFRIMPLGYGKASKEVRDYITNLQQENERLKEENEKYIKAYMEIKKEYEKTLNHLLIDNKAQRIDKAIEYIKDNCSYEEDTKYCYDDLCSNDVNNLLNILQNGSEEK